MTITLVARPNRELNTSFEGMRPINIYIETMGCAKNSVDSEYMAGYLSTAGHKIVSKPQNAEVVIVNTCGFIQPAVEENIEVILEFGRLKESGDIQALIVTGCLPQRYQHNLAQEFPEVDGFLGTGEYHLINEIIAKVMAHNRPEFYTEQRRFLPDLPRKFTNHIPSAYVKIAEGCPRFCSFCVIPKIRGRLHSRPRPDIVKEVERLAAAGTKEIVLVAQDSTAYGLDLVGKPQLAKLIQELARIEELRWIRFLYGYPELITEELLQVMAGEEKVCAYLDLPLQHVSQPILTSMGREGSYSRYRKLLDLIRSYLPEAAIRSTFILGYPGETEEDFRLLLDFVEEARFNHLAVFTYYPEEGTRAANLPDQVPPELARERMNRLLDLQQVISSEINQSRVGKLEEVLVDTANKREGTIIGRSFREAPEIDSIIKATITDTGFLPKPGEIVRVEITAADDQELQGTIRLEGEQE